MFPLKRQFAPMFNYAPDGSTKVIVDEEYVTHCANIARILAHADGPCEAKWKLREYERLVTDAPTD